MADRSVSGSVQAQSSSASSDANVIVAASGSVSARKALTYGITARDKISTVSDTLSLPSSPSYQSANIRFKSINGEVRSPFTGDSQITGHPGEFWKGELVLPPMTESEFVPWKNFILKARGKRKTFKVGDPLNSSPSGSAKGTPEIAGPGNAPLVEMRGDSDYITIGDDSAFDISSSITLEIYFSIRDTDKSHVLASKAVDNSRDEEWEVGITSRQTPYFTIGDGSENITEANFKVKKSVPYHIAAVFDGSNMRLLIDGSAVNQKSLSSSITNASGDIRIGGRPNGKDWLDGRVSDFRIWSTDRTDTEIQNNLTHTQDGTESNLAGYWPLNDGQDSTPNDKTSNNNHSTLKGDASWVKSQGERIIIRGWDANENGVLKAGDNIEVSDRLKSVIFDEDSNSAGVTKTNVRPQFRQPIDEGTSVITSNPKGEFRLQSNEKGWEERAPRIYEGLSLQIIEHF